MTTFDLGDTEGLLVYAVVRGGHRVPPRLLGVGDSPTRVVAHGSLGAVVSELRLDRPPGRRLDLTRFSELVDALPEGGPVAPVRFGCVLPDERSIVDELLLPREAELGDLLEYLDGRLQYNLRARYVDEAVLTEIVQGDQQIQWLREHTRDLPDDVRVGDRIRLGELVSRAWERMAHTDAEAILDQLAPVVAAHTLRREPGTESVLDAALLVDVGRTDEVEDLLEQLAADSAERMRLRLVGPVAAYDFAGIS